MNLYSLQNYIYYLEVVSINFVDLQPAQKKHGELSITMTLLLFLMLVNNHFNKQRLRFFGKKIFLHKESNIDCENWFAFVYLYTVYL